MSEVDPNKMKVVELRAELSARGLDTKGNKAVLVQRLQQVLDQEKGEDAVSEGDEGIEDNTSQEGSSAEDSSSKVVKPVKDETNVEKDDEIDDDDPPESEKESETPAEDGDKIKPVEPIVKEEDSKMDADGDTVSDGDAATDGDATVDKDAITDKDTTSEPDSVAEKEATADKEAVENDVLKAGKDDPVDTSGEAEDKTPEIKEDTGDVEEVDQSVKETEKDEEMSVDPPPEIKEEKVENGTTKTETEPIIEFPDEQQRRGEKRRRSSSPFNERRRNRSRSRSHERKRSRSKSPPKEEPEEVFDDSLVTLDTYNSDLNLLINKDRYSADPMTDGGFGFMWAGARASYGFDKGKVYFEMKVLKELDVGHLPEDEPSPHVIRVGVSTEKTTLQLGEDPQSYGYGGTAKASTDCQFKDYGVPFSEGDVVSCFVDLDNDPIELSFAKNGELQGVAYSITREEIESKPLFPHILSKNCSFEVNFGQKESPFITTPEGYEQYIVVGNVPLEDRIRGRCSPLTKGDCEMIMMCGLPGSGKTTWANDYSAKNPEKNFNVLGTNNIIDKMKVMGLPRKRNYAGRWDVLIDMSTKCLNKLLDVASRFKRNYILDQTNVYASAQRRKMRPFEGFKRRAVVLVPTDDEFNRRIAKREKEEGKDVPESAVIEMKANFTPPETGTFFEEVEYIELPEQEAIALVEVYRKDGRAAMPPPEKRFRSNDRGGPPRGGRFGPPVMHNRDRDRGRHEDRRGYNSPSRGGYGSPGRGGGLGAGYGGYRDTRNSGGYNRGGMGGPQHRGGMNRGGPGGRNQHSGSRGSPRGNRSYGGGGSGGGGGGSYNRDRSYHSMQVSKSHKGSGQGYGHGGGYGGHGGGYEQNYQSYNYGPGQQSGQPGYGQSQWKQSGYGGQGYGSGYSPQNYQSSQSSYSSQPSSNQQVVQQQPQSPQSYYNQQYYNQQWSQWNQNQQQYYSQYYNQYYNPSTGYGSYSQQSGNGSSSTSSTSQQK